MLFGLLVDIGSTGDRRPYADQIPLAIGQGGVQKRRARPQAKWKAIVHSPTQILLASDVSFRRLNGCMPYYKH
jgi:hypothetical protein